MSTIVIKCLSKRITSSAVFAITTALWDYWAEAHFLGALKIYIKHIKHEGKSLCGEECDNAAVTDREILQDSTKLGSAAE